MQPDVALFTANVAQAAPLVVRLIPRVHAHYAGCRVVGPALTCKCGPGDNLALHRALQRAVPGQVLVCDAGGEVGVGHCGELMARDAQNRGVQGLVINGAVRDAEDLQALGFPVFCMGTAPFQSKKVVEGAVGERIDLNGVEVNTGDIVVADRDAVVIVPEADWETVRQRAEEIAHREEQIREQMQQGRRLADILSLPALDRQ